MSNGKQSTGAQRMSKLGLISAGAVLGLLGAIGVNRWLLTAPPARGESPNAGSNASRDELRALEQRMNALSNQMQSIPARVATKTAHPALPSPGSEPADRPSRLEEPPDARADLEAREFAKQQEHAAEAVDSTWASVANRELGEDLASAGAKLGAKVQSVDCRTRTCRVELAWTSHEQASRHHYELLTTPLRQTCGFFALLPPPGTGRDGYTQSVLLDCR